LTPLNRLRERLWLLLAALLAIFLTYEFATLAPFSAPLSAIAVLAVAAFLPTSAENAARRAGIQIETASVKPLSASDFAAALSDPVIFFDGAGFVVDANKSATETFGALNPGLSLLLKFRVPELRLMVEKLISGDVPAAIDYAERIPVERLFRVSGSRVGEGEKLFVLVFKDQSEARRIDRMRADFIANASHELRTPLASVSGFIETLRGPAKNDPKAREQFLEIMQNQTGRMARLIDDLLSLSRLEMKPRLDTRATTDLKTIVGSVVDSLSPLAKESGVAIEKAFAEADAIVAGDRDELFQVFENLLENACKYGQSGGRVIVSIAPGTTGPRAEIDVTVSDFGPGIPAEHIPRITERFYRVDVETSRAQKGTGLGLAIVKHILTRHNGRLSVHSELGKGSQFTAHLPAVK
jgi:two-component system phosphate regulon sensor histidine kinase PhoR